jgi:hypothetical protein
MNERYRYGYGEDVPGRDSPLTGGSSVTDEREVDATRADEEDEERRADRIREAADESRTDESRTDESRSDESRSDESRTDESSDQTSGDDHEASGDDHEASATATDDDADSSDASDHTPGSASTSDTTTNTTRHSVFDVEDDAAGPGGAKGAGAETSDASRSEDDEERAPIALGPPRRDGDEPTTNDDLAASTNGAPATGTTTPYGSTAGQATSVFEPATPAGTTLGEGGTEAQVVATEEPPVVAPDQDAATTADRPPEGGSGTIEQPSSLLGAIDPDDTRAKFLDIQAGFVDEPRQAVQEAENFVDDLVRQLVKALETERASLKAAIASGSTEDLRIALRGYRAFVDRLLKLG